MINRSQVLSKQPQRQLVVVVWQSLVLDAYRSFFFKLSQFLIHPNSEVVLIAPEWFYEAGNQKILCESLGPEFLNSPKFRLVTLPISMRHVQAVWYWGLGSFFRQLRNEAQKDNDTNIIILCMSEPYAITSLVVWLSAWINLRFTRWFFIPYALQNICKDFSWPIRWIEKFILAHSEMILSLGTEQNKVLESKGNQKPIVYFPLWYDQKIFKPASRENGRSVESVDKGLNIGFVGKLCAEKGVPDLCAAIQLLDPSWKKKLHFIFVGKVFWDQWESQIKQLRDEGWDIVHKGALPLKEVSRIYRELDLLVVPSRTELHWKEQFGRIIVEAYACGLPVLGSSSGAIPEVLFSKDFVFPERSPKDLAEKLGAFVQGKLNVPREQLMSFAADRYSDGALAQKFASVLDQIGS